MLRLLGSLTTLGTIDWDGRNIRRPHTPQNCLTAPPGFSGPL